MTLPRPYVLKFIKKEQESKDAFSFYFERPADFEFLPGQHISILLEIANPDEKGNRRNFSISSSPTEKDFLRITSRIRESSFKQTLMKLNVGTEVKIIGPIGNFVLNEQEKGPHILLAGGIGITPFRSMIKFVHDKKLDVSIILFASFSTSDDLIFNEEFEEIIKSNNSIKIVETVTKPEESTTAWKGQTGRINKELIKKYVADIPSSIFYLCGPPEMVISLSDIVKDMGVKEDKIRKEQFTGY